MYVNCPKCGRRLLEGKIGSDVQVKCYNCSRVFNAKILSKEIIIVFKDNIEEENNKDNN